MGAKPLTVAELGGVRRHCGAPFSSEATELLRLVMLRLLATIDALEARTSPERLRRAADRAADDIVTWLQAPTHPEFAASSRILSILTEEFTKEER